MLSCIWTTSNKSERLMHLVGWFIWMHDDARTCKPWTCINCSPIDTLCPQSKHLGYLITETWDLYPLNIKFRSDCTILVFRSFGIPAVNLVCLTLGLVMFIHSSYEHYQDDGYLQCNSLAWRNYKIYLYIGFLNISLSENWGFNVQYFNQYCTSSFIMRLMSFKWNVCRLLPPW